MNKQISLFCRPFVKNIKFPGTNIKETKQNKMAVGNYHVTYPNQ